MNARQFRLVSAVLVAAAAVGGVAASAAGSSAAKAPPNFRVIATGPVGFAYGDGTNGCAVGSFLVTGDAPAQGTHIGGVGTLQTSECATVDPATGLNHVDGKGVLTATGGDQIFYDYGGDTAPPNQATGVVSEELSFTITGGTGHFAGASGGGTLHSHGNFYVAVTAELDGTISLHAR